MNKDSYKKLYSDLKDIDKIYLLRNGYPNWFLCIMRFFYNENKDYLKLWCENKGKKILREFKELSIMEE